MIGGKFLKAATTKALVVYSRLGIFNTRGVGMLKSRGIGALNPKPWRCGGV